jgi:5-amino-6-(5-phosphoribosylamino)uracil reductase
LKNPHLVKERVDKGLSPELTKVTLTRSGKLDPKSKFFTTGEATKIVFCSPSMRGIQKKNSVRSNSRCLTEHLIVLTD